MRVRVIRAFYANGKPLKPKDEIDLKDHIAREVIWMGKAEAIVESPPAGPMTTESATELVGGKARRGDKDAAK